VCEECATNVFDICTSKAKDTPHCITIHDKESDRRFVLSFCSGTVMRKLDTKESMWIDSEVGGPVPESYKGVVSSVVGLIPFLAYIDPTRAGLSCTYISKPFALLFANLTLLD
jgi:hypothetical protein